MIRVGCVVSLVLLGCASARPAPSAVERTSVHVPQLAVGDAPGAEEIKRQLKREFDELASCEPQAVERVSVDGEVTLRAPRLIGLVAHVDVTCVGALHPTIENVSFFFDAVSGARLPTVLKPDAEPELAGRYQAKARPLGCEDQHIVVHTFLLQPRADGLLVTPNVGWALQACVESVVLTWQELDGLLAQTPSQ